MVESMWVVVFVPEGMDQGREYLRRELDPDELMDSRAFADEVARSLGVEVGDSDGYVPSCSGDIRVEFRQDPDNPVVVWRGESFYFKREDY